MPAQSRRQLFSSLAAASSILARPAPSRIHLACSTSAWPSLPEAFAALPELGFTGFALQSGDLADKALQQVPHGLAFVSVRLAGESYDHRAALETAHAAARLEAQHLILECSAGLNPETLNQLGQDLLPLRLTLAYQLPAVDASAERLVALTDPSTVYFALNSASPNLPGFLVRHHNRLAALQISDSASNLQSLAHILKKAGWSGWLLANPSSAPDASQTSQILRDLFHA